MPKSSKKELATKAAYNAKPENKAKRAEYGRNRYAYEKANGDLPTSVHLDHKKPLDAGGSHGKENLRPMPAAENKGWRARQPKMYGKKK